MKSVLIAAVSAVQAYLLGSVDTGILVSKFLYHDDVRKYGSGAAGMTNMLRTFGKKAAALTAFGDVLKGVLPCASAAGCSLRCRKHHALALSCGVPCRHPCDYRPFKAPVFRLQGRQGRAGGGRHYSGHPAGADPLLAVIFLVCLLPTGMVSLGSVTMAALYPLLTILYGCSGAILPPTLPCAPLAR